MAITVQQKINAPRERVWDIITDIEHAADNIAGIESVEVLDKPEQGIVGLKWRETRKFAGKTEILAIGLFGLFDPALFQRQSAERMANRLNPAPGLVIGPVSYTHLTLPTKRIV